MGLADLGVKASTDSDWLTCSDLAETVPLDLVATHMPDWVTKLSLRNASGSLHDLRGKQLQALSLRDSPSVTGSLEDLHSMPLQELMISGTQVTGSLEDLHSMPLQKLMIAGTQVTGS